MQVLKVFMLWVLVSLSVAESLSAAMAIYPTTYPTKRQERQLERAQLETVLGRPLRFGERLALQLTRPFRKHTAAMASLEGTAVTAGAFSLLGILLLIIGAAAGAGGVALTGLLFCMVAPILGIIGLGRIRRSKGLLKGKGFAILGIVLGFLVVGLTTAFLISFAQGW